MLFAGGDPIDPMLASKPGRWRLRAAMAWVACLAGAALALELIVLAVEIGPFNLGLAGTIAASTVVAVGGGVAFWRLVAGRRKRPRLAALLLVVAVGWASLGALVMAWLIAAFNP